MVTNMSSSSVCQTKDSITINEGLYYKYDLSWLNINSCQIPELTTKDMKENILDINVIVSGKVVEITFCDMLKEKMVCHKDDTFDLRKCCFIAIAKHLYKKEYTQEGIEYMATQLTYQKKYVKIVDKALKEYNKKMKEEEKRVRKEEEEKLIYERQSAKRRKQKERREKRHRDALVNMISDAINQSDLFD